ncbi:hypothetical protein LQ938_06065 [Microbacterium sp. cx-55]|uniref:hypothetical protein n=1 Tax=Microbacterium sp. cx-55 TaxID=2875948 RepID=UPI001CC0531F|nr:hypothetical protein [Microbacterium sp. cx-55]MBZ4486692.1 hypothetical protein [Microbacterium sp. cx-55]UGB36348.1 hypothetical protein LQ938_06065 [Microbacterium sp. cx-55]
MNLFDGSGRPQPGDRLRRAALSSLGWLLATVGVLIILSFLAGGAPEWVSNGAVAAVAIAIGVSALVPVGLGIAYRLVRARLRAAEAIDRDSPAAPRARVAQTVIATLLDSVHSASGDVLGTGHLVDADRVRLTAATVGEFGDRREALAFIWVVRPSQRADFPESPQFRGLPDWARHAVVLLDLRRAMALQGDVAALKAASGFYRHPFERMLLAAGATGDDGLGAALRVAHTAAEHSDTGPEGEAAFGRLRDLLDDMRVWARIID